MSNGTTTALTGSAVLPVTGFAVSNAVGLAMLFFVAGAGFVVAVSSRWSRRRHDRSLGVRP